MNFLNPWGLLFALFIPGVIILYLLKQQHEDLPVSSTYLWEKALEDVQANVPWQKLRKNILLFLQIAAILFMALAISRPFVIKQETSQDYIVILDCSASMQAQDIKPSRFSKAKQDIENLIDGMFPGQKMTIIEAAKLPGIIVNQTSDKGILKESLMESKPANTVSNIEEAISLANALVQEMSNGSIYVYTDQYFETSNRGITTFVYNEEGVNRGIANVSYTIGDQGPVVLSSIVNYGQDCDLTLECKVDGATIDVKEVSIETQETANVYWNNIPKQGRVVEISIIEDDDLIIDNQGWTVMDTSSNLQVLLVTERNAFLEKAVKLRTDIKLDKTTFEQAEAIDGYQLYIYDGYLPEVFPKDGSIIIFNPAESQEEEIFLRTGEEFAPGSVKIGEYSSYKELIEYVDPEQFHIAKAVSLKYPSWMEVVLDDGENPILLAGEQGNQRFVVFPFDIHNSDLPLKPDFPILIQNILEWTLPRVVDQDTQKFAGEELRIYSLPHAEEIYVTTPSGRNIQVAPPFPIPFFNDTEEVGVYKVEQVLDEERIENFFTVHIPVYEESDIRSITKVLETDGQVKNDRTISMGNKEIWSILALMALMLILVEWWVYQRGY